MNHLKNAARAVRAFIAVSAASAPGRVRLAVLAGVAAAEALCAFLVNFRHAALAASAAQAPSQSVNQILVTGWIATFLVAAIVTYSVITAVVRIRQIRRTRQAPIATGVRDITPDWS